MKTLTAEEVQACGIRTLGLDSTAYNLLSIEAIAAALRRVAGFSCPCPQRTLVQAVVEPLDEIIDDTPQFTEDVENTLEAMLTYGDLLEELEVAAVGRAHRSSLIYAAPPSFIRRKSGVVFIIGIAPDRNSAAPERLEKRINYLNHIRRLFPENDEDLSAELKQFGLSELSVDAWLKQVPSLESASEHLKRITSRFRATQGSIDGLIILNSSKPVDHYRRRWEDAGNNTGRFVARRPQAYGNDLWCYVELIQGQTIKLLDFPLENRGFRGCDEAWRLQLAIDAERSEPQRFRVRNESRCNIVEFYSPLPIWALRRWDIIGEPTRTASALFAYTFDDKEITEEIEFMRRRLWLEDAL
ncbi:MAG: hypothetical protein QOH41_798 [Blastocatellia bacterium]|jgi:hypothetical protein|nr:hypothetical protein [Blastocatellia bacterium]